MTVYRDGAGKEVALEDLIRASATWATNHIIANQEEIARLQAELDRQKALIEQLRSKLALLHKMQLDLIIEDCAYDPAIKVALSPLLERIQQFLPKKGE